MPLRPIELKPENAIPAVSSFAPSPFRHDRTDKVGVLVTNLGTPDSPEIPAVRRYLREFLSDHRVVEMPRPVWWLILNLVILWTRTGRSAAAYRRVWTDQGSPLMSISKRQVAVLAEKLSALYGEQILVTLAMRYGNPSVAQGLRDLARAGAHRILVFPLYPQYSATTTASTFDAVCNELMRWRRLPEMRFVNHYHDHIGYIRALADSARVYWADHGRPERLLMSFHGIPQAYFDQGDPYYCECMKTGRLLAEELGLQDTDWMLTFQSRVGPKDWLRPYTDATLARLGREGIETVHAICPGFSADCLETLDEIAVENKELFRAAGGREFGYIPCLNDNERHLEALLDIAGRHLVGWLNAGDRVQDVDSINDRLKRARAMGAKT